MLFVVAIVLVGMFHPHANDELIVEMTAEVGLIDENCLTMAIERRELRRRHSTLARLLRQQRILTADRGYRRERDYSLLKGSRGPKVRTALFEITATVQAMTVEFDRSDDILYFACVIARVDFNRVE